MLKPEKMPPFILAEKPSIANHFLAELRDVSVQKDSMRFRRNMQRLGEVLAYEISKTLAYQAQDVTTPLGIWHADLLEQEPILVAILRASLPFHQGFLNVFDHAPSAFIGAYRGKHKADETFDIAMDYIASPRLQDRTIIMADPMLATGKSLVKSYEALLNYGSPKRVIVASAIAAPEGVALIQQEIPHCELFIGAVDSHLNQKFYIIPGLGDAGDLAYGEKI